MIVSRDNEKLKLVRKLHERRWRDKLGLFVCEGEDLVEAATAEPVELLVAGENVEPALLAEVSTAAHPPRVIGVYRREDLPAADGAAGGARALARRRPGERRHADPHRGCVRRGGRALARAAPTRRGPKALRASAGSIWRVPLLAFARDCNRKRVALVAHGGVPLGECDLGGGVTFLLGAEREGLPAEVERDLEATIPVDVESLNVAVTGAIALYEWRRQNAYCRLFRLIPPRVVDPRVRSQASVRAASSGALQGHSPLLRHRLRQLPDPLTSAMSPS